MYRKMILVIVLLLFSSCSSYTGVQKQNNQATGQLEQLFADDWEYQLKESPLFATFYGDKRYNAALPSVSVADNQRRLAQEKAFLTRLAEIDRNALSATHQLNYDIFKLLKQNDIAEYQFKTYLTPITNRSGFHVSFPQLADRVPLNSVEDYENYIARLNGFEVYAQSYIELMRAGISEGYVLPGITLKGIEGTIEPHIVKDASESLLFAAFEKFPDDIDEAAQANLTEAGKSAILNSVVPGYEAFLKFITEEYLPAAREDIAASSLPDGKAFYEHRVRLFTTLDITPKEVHKIGHSEVKRIRGEMEELIRETGFEGSFQDFVQFLRTDDRFYVDSPKALMAQIALTLKLMDGQLPTLFKTLPRSPYGIKKIPDFIAPKTTTAYYNSPAGDGSKAGFYFVNTYDLRSRPTYEIEALSFHEAVPGHHLQIALQQEMENIPEFRKYASFTAFVEGWALYSERLGLEVGFYEDPYSDFGRLTYEMWRALRLVVDTGMHYFGWSRQKAIDYMAENSALTMHNITTEIDRYISWPGQALGYKMGELKIRELRAYSKEKLGDKFDVREFHEVVLGSGAVPMNVLEANVTDWVSNKLSER
ncbi:MAG: DUF885 domain-containing protein [Candidatus Marinimicrobia bacterium]|nr:DUF885 domain-containing protein [Candidatus Neomarinimicrobiota bacterium]